MHIIPGKEIANKYLQNIAAKIDQLPASTVRFGIIQIGNDDATKIYVNHKINDAKKVGIEVELALFEQTTMDEVVQKIKEFNSRQDISGFIVQLPIWIDGDLNEILNYVNPNKDVDGMTASNLGYLWHGQESRAYLPATVAGVIRCLEYVAVFRDGKYTVEELHPNHVVSEYQNYMRGKNIVIINDSIIVGRPLAATLANTKSTITLCHRATRNLKEHTQKADIVISATGVPRLLSARDVRDDAVLVDVGIVRDDSGRVTGDFDFESFGDTNVWITPVPGGVGPLTRAMLLQNVLDAYFVGQKSGSLKY